jgi:hypothetical protein
MRRRVDGKLARGWEGDLPAGRELTSAVRDLASICSTNTPTSVSVRMKRSPESFPILYADL